MLESELISKKNLAKYGFVETLSNGFVLELEEVSITIFVSCGVVIIQFKDNFDDSIVGFQTKYKRMNQLKELVYNLQQYDIETKTFSFEGAKNIDKDLDNFKRKDSLSVESLINYGFSLDKAKNVFFVENYVFRFEISFSKENDVTLTIIKDVDDVQLMTVYDVNFNSMTELKVFISQISNIQIKPI